MLMKPGGGCGGKKKSQTNPQISHPPKTSQCDTHNDEEFLHIPPHVLAFKRWKVGLESLAESARAKGEGFHLHSPPAHRRGARRLADVTDSWMDVNWGRFRIPHRPRSGVGHEKEREGPGQPGPMGFRHSGPASFQKESGHRINTAPPIRHLTLP